MTEKNEVAIKVDHVSKTFKLPHERQTSIKGALINIARGGSRSFEKQRVLNDVSFEINKGEFFGIVGRNGSGKSTLLKLLAGIYTPTKGGVQINGKLTPFIELGVGFNPELTGRENVFLNGALLGFNRSEMEAMYEDIVAFAEIEKFMDQKLKNYSSGMQVRLAFSIAIRVNTDILVLDEVLAVGDEAFQQKCFEYFYNLKKEKRTIVFVSHDMASVQKFCDRAVVINDGDLLFYGDPTEAALLYKELNFPKIAEGEDDYNSDNISVSLLNKDGKSQTTFKHGDEMIVEVGWKQTDKAKDLGIAIHSADGVYVYGTNTIDKKPFIKEGQDKAQYHVKLNLGSGSYYIEAAVFGVDESIKIAYTPRGATFAVHNMADWMGVTELEHSWSSK
jgi:ABC-2 type transport system ATP-binding protein